ncbi:ATP-binding protein [Streptomyces sp. NPDC097727]|uniref:ATP-binding protein n=1 Tax=Streptomyces sp. NPDC097727 TaxID=3366092 RepID=UPI00382FC291
MGDRTAPDTGLTRPDGQGHVTAEVLRGELTAVLHRAVDQAAHRLRAVAAAVYLLTPDGGELRAAMIGGSPPSVFTPPGRMPLDSSSASARALAGHGVALLAEPDHLTGPEHGATAYPYTVASVPLETGGHRFGSLTVLRTENKGVYSDEDCRRLARIGDRLAGLLAGLHARGAVIAPGNLPLLVPVLGTAPGPVAQEETVHRRDDAALLPARYEGTDDGSSPRTALLHIHRRDLRAVGEARGFVRDRLCDWGLADLSDDLVLITSELVTNALVHAGSEVDLRLRVLGDRVRLEVWDSGGDPLVPSASSLTDEGCARAEHGRGLFLVDALADTWHTSPNGRGRTVWLEMDIPGAASGPAE